MKKSEPYFVGGQTAVRVWAIPMVATVASLWIALLLTSHKIFSDDIIVLCPWVGLLMTTAYAPFFLVGSKFTLPRTRRTAYMLFAALCASLVVGSIFFIGYWLAGDDLSTSRFSIFSHTLTLVVIPIVATVVVELIRSVVFKIVTPKKGWIIEIKNWVYFPGYLLEVGFFECAEINSALKNPMQLFEREELNLFLSDGGKKVLLTKVKAHFNIIHQTVYTSSLDKMQAEIKKKALEHIRAKARTCTAHSLISVLSEREVELDFISYQVVFTLPPDSITLLD